MRAYDADASLSAVSPRHLPKTKAMLGTLCPLAKRLLLLVVVGLLPFVHGSFRPRCSRNNTSFCCYSRCHADDDAINLEQLKRNKTCRIIVLLS